MRIPFDINGAFVVQSSRSQIGTKNDRKHISPHSWQAIASAQDVCLILQNIFVYVGSTTSRGPLIK